MSRCAQDMQLCLLAIFHPPQFFIGFEQIQNYTLKNIGLPNIGLSPINVLYMARVLNEYILLYNCSTTCKRMFLFYSIYLTIHGNYQVLHLRQYNFWKPAKI